MSAVTTIRPRLLWPRYDGGGPSWGSSVTPTHATCSSLPMRAVATGIVHAPGSTDWQFADETRLCVHVSHFPPGTSKWNKIEHRLFCHITQNWRGKPLRSFETIVDLIGSTRTEAWASGQSP